MRKNTRCYNIEQMQQKKSNFKVTDYQLEGVIGQGVFGTVLQGKNKNAEERVAIKKILKKTHQGFSSSLYRQIAFLTKHKHPNLIEMLGYNVSGQKQFAFLCFELLTSDLSKMLKTKGTLTLEQTKKVIKGILKGIHYIHRQNYLHRDIKPSNILVDSNLQVVKVGDLGLIRQQFFSPTCLTLQVSSLHYKAPEILLKNSYYNSAIDIWGIGCILAECILGYQLFKSSLAYEILQLKTILKSFGVENLSPENLIYDSMKQSIQNASFEGLLRQHQKLNDLGPQGLDLLKKMLTLLPETRITAEEALQHDFFSSDDEKR